MSNSNTLIDHLNLPSKKKDLDWIKKTLQSAIELEHATLPLYLSTMSQNLPASGQVGIPSNINVVAPALKGP